MELSFEASGSPLETHPERFKGGEKNQGYSL